MIFLRDLPPGQRLLICVAVGVAVFLSAPASFGPAIRSALGWIAAAGCFLGLTAFAVGGAPPERLRALARQQDARRWVILGLIILAAMVSLIAVTLLLHKQDGE